MTKTMTLSPNTRKISQDLLKWYDANKRVLPWRAEGMTPYQVWLSEIMLQQTTVPAVISYYTKFLSIWPTIEDLAKAPQEDVMQEWAGLGYYARARNLHKCAQMVAFTLDGQFPEDIEGLKKLPGIGDYTANAIAAIAFGKDAVIVDSNVERVMARIFAIQEPLPRSKKILKDKAATIFKHTKRAGDLGQGFMDLGTAICTVKSPKCMLCPVHTECAAYAAGIAEKLPVKAPKKAKPQRYGYFYWIENDKGQILLERRKEKAMLGGMLGLPTSEWLEDNQALSHAPAMQKPQIIEGAIVRHSFTHFDLELQGYRARINKAARDERVWIPKQEVDKAGLPTLFKKAVKIIS